MSLKLAVWDVDGTLVDSRTVIFDAAKAVFAAMDLPPPDYEDVRQIVGLNLAEGLRLLLPGMGPDVVDRAVAGYKDVFQDMHRQPGFIEPLYEGAAECLERLRQDGWRIAMATGKSRRAVVGAVGGVEQVGPAVHPDDGLDAPASRTRTCCCRPCGRWAARRARP